MLSESFLNKADNRNHFTLNGYKLLCIDHPNNVKRRGVCIYYKETFGFKLVSIPYLSDCGLAEVTAGLKQCIHGVFCICPSEHANLRDSFVTFFCALKYSKSQGIRRNTEDGRNTKWWGNDITNITEGTQFETLTTIYGFPPQFIDELSRIWKNSSSCIDLVFEKTRSTLLLIVELTLLFLIIAKSKLTLARPVFELNTPCLMNNMSGIMQKLTLLE